VPSTDQELSVSFFKVISLKSVIECEEALFCSEGATRLISCPAFVKCSARMTIPGAVIPSSLVKSIFKLNP
jgi:hypothetical protein